MSVFFGTDGIRGLVGTELNFFLAYQCGNSLSQHVEEGKKVLIGCDTRTSNSYIISSLASGLMAGGVDVVCAGVLPTAAIAYLTKERGFAYGVAITASHNPGEYNGIKIFSSLGEKLSEKEEEKIERGFVRGRQVDGSKIGRFKFDGSLKNVYKNFILRQARCSLSPLTIAIDASNGAGYYLAPKVFSELGARVVKVSCKNDGKAINLRCGSLHPERLAEKVVKCGADLGLCFDGDADRLIAVDQNGAVVDGDHILLALAKAFKASGQLSQNTVVGTSMTNMGIEAEMEKNGIKLLRADVGDKYVAKAMFGQGLSLGGEQSGHIIIAKSLRTGDGILTAVELLCAFKESGKTFSQFVAAPVYPLVLENVCVAEKLRVLGSETLHSAVSAVQQELGGQGRVIVRASGTEPKIRIMVESGSEERSRGLADYLVGVVRTIEASRGEPCAE